MFIFTNISYFSLTLIPVLLFTYIKSPIRFSVKIIVFSGILIYFFCAINGLFIYNNPFNFIGFDFSNGFTIISFIILGTQPDFWDDFLRSAFWFHFFGIVINIWGTFIITDVDYFSMMLDTDKNNRVALLFLSYQTQMAVYLWTFLLFSYKKLNKWKLFFLVFSIIFIIVQQILFQKRAPIGRIMAFILAFIFFVNEFKLFSYKKALIAKVQVILLVVMTSAFGIFIYLKDNFIINQLIGLGNRFSNPSYESKKIGFFSFERIDEIIIMFNTFKWFEFIFGKGLGGYYEDYTRYYAFQENPILHKYISQSPHIGIFDSYLKGGIFLFIFYNLVFIGALLRFRYTKGNEILSFSFILLLFAFFFLYIEGFHAQNTSCFQLILISISIGYLYNFKKNMISFTPK